MLPKIKHPTFETVLPVSKKKITFRPFTVKEQKILLLAKEMDSVEQIVNSMLQILRNCVVSPSKFDPEKLTSVDIEWAFLQARIKSIGETSDLTWACKEKVVDPETNETKICGGKIEHQVNLNDIRCSEVNDTKIVFESGQEGIVLTYPNIKTALDVSKTVEADVDVNEAKMIYQLTDYVFDSSKTYTKEDFTFEEFYDWLNTLLDQDFKKIEKFFDDAPELMSDPIKLQCKKCGTVHEIELKGLESFF